MKRTLLFAAFMTACAFTSGAQDKVFTCILKGKVMNGDSKYVRILERGKNLHNQGHDIALNPDGTFDYEVKDSLNRQYEIILGAELTQGWISAYEFISEPGSVHAELYQTIFKSSHTMNDSLYRLSSVKGGPVNARYSAEKKYSSTKCAEASSCQAEMVRMHNTKEAYSEKAQGMLKSMETCADSSASYKSKLNAEFMALTKKPQEFYSQAYLEVKDVYDAAAKTCYKDRCDHMAANPDIASLCILYGYALNKKPNMDTAAFISAYKVLAGKYPAHPYANAIGLAVKSFDSVIAGKPFINFTAPDLSGTQHTLSEEIKDRIAVLDLWASWCGPCIKNGLKLKPVYEKYKDKGFVVVGVAREFMNTKALEGALKRTGYPWLNLLEMDDRINLWAQYGVPKSGGAVFLIDRKGRIVAINPTDEEIESYLEQNL